MPTTTAPPILVWTPGGGIPIGPVSNPPVYSQAGITKLINGQSYVDVVFGSVQATTDWVLVTCDVENTVDLSPLNIWPGIITSRTVAGFRLYLNGLPDTANYYLHWAVSGVNITPSPASTYLLSGPGSGGAGSIFTVRLPPSTTVPGPITVTPNDSGNGGTFLPASVVLTTTSASASFAYTPASYGTKTIGVTNSGTLIDPTALTFNSVVTTYTLSGPSSGTTGVASTNFTVALPVGGTVSGTITVTLHDGGGGGTFTPATVSLTTGAPSTTFTYTPASNGAKTISSTNNGGLTDPASLTYTAVAPAPHLLNTLISYWKMDEASGTRNDSVGTNNLTPTGTVTTVGGLINNAVYFNGTGYLSIASNASLQVTSDFTFSVWVTLGGGGADNGIICKSDASSLFEYLLAYNTSTGFQFNVGGVVKAQVGAPASGGVWIHIVGWYDSSDQKVRMRINDATTYVSTGTVTPAATAAPFNIGQLGAGAWEITAFVDEVGFWKRKLTTLEITALYNGGAGLPYSSFTT